eukprot:SAG11_NODE_4802_length_1761_cov_4.421781_1_plen_262_part_00
MTSCNRGASRRSHTRLNVTLVWAKKLKELKLASGETVRQLLIRATELRARLKQMGVRETNYHMRQYVIDALGRDSDIMKRVRSEVGSADWKYEESKTRLIAFEEAMRPEPATNFLMELDADVSPAKTEVMQLAGSTQVTPDGLSFDEYTKRQIQSARDKAYHQALYAGKGKQTDGKGKGSGGKHKRGGRQPKKSLAEKEKKPLPGFAKMEFMQKFYKPKEWEHENPPVFLMYPVPKLYLIFLPALHFVFENDINILIPPTY